MRAATANRPLSPYVGVSFVIVAILALRIRWQLADPQFWAEDGTIFFAQAIRYGAASIAMPYAGYLHSIAHIIAVILAAFPVLWAPALYQDTALVLDALSCAAFALPAFRVLMPSDVLRYACCLVFAALPYSDDLIGNIANVQWFFSIVLLLALLVTPSSRQSNTRTLVQIVALVAIVLTCAEALLFLPIVIYRVCTWTGRARMIVLAILCATGVQAIVTLMHSKTMSAAPIGGGTDSAAAILRLFAYKVVLSNVAGIAAARAVDVAPLVIECAAIAVTAIVFASVAYVYRLAPAKWITAAYLFLVPPIAFVASRGYGPVFRDPHADVFWSGMRYTLLASAMLICAVAALVAAVLPKNRPLLAPVVLLLIFAPAIGSNFEVGALTDRNWPSEAAQITAYERSPIAAAIHAPINPSGWYIDLPRKGEPVKKAAAVGAEMMFGRMASESTTSTARVR